MKTCPKSQPRDCPKKQLNHQYSPFFFLILLIPIFTLYPFLRSNRSVQLRIIKLGARAPVRARNLILLRTRNAQVGTAREGCIRVLEPDLGELGKTGQGGAVVGPLDDPVGIDAGEGGACVDVEALGVAAAGVYDFSEAWG